MKKVLIIIIVALIGVYAFFSIKKIPPEPNKDNQEKLEQSIEEATFEIDEELVKNSIIGTQKFDDGSSYMECESYMINCFYPSEAYKTVLTEIVIGQLDEDEQKEVFVVESSIAGNNFGTGVGLILEYLGDDNFEIVKTEPIVDRGEITTVRMKPGQIELLIDLSWKGEGEKTQIITIE